MDQLGIFQAFGTNFFEFFGVFEIPPSHLEFTRMSSVVTSFAQPAHSGGRRGEKGEPVAETAETGERGEMIST